MRHTRLLHGRRLSISLLRSLATNRLAQFLAIGACLFALSRPPRDSSEIRIAHARLESLEREQARRLGVTTLDETQRKAVEMRAIEDELLYREALRLGLDQDDSIVRERLIQKALFLAEDLGGASRNPSESDLRAFYQATRARWVHPASCRFVHVVASKREALLALRPRVEAFVAAAPDDAIPPFGESLPISRLVIAGSEEMEARFGAGFARAVEALPPRVLSEPVASKYGFHLVRVIERIEPRPATFDEVRAELRLAYLIAKREQAVQSRLSAILAQHRVYLDNRPVHVIVSSGRVAARNVRSAED